jgi:AraC-like DNA-binding protein
MAQLQQAAQVFRAHRMTHEETGSVLQACQGLLSAGNEHGALQAGERVLLQAQVSSAQRVHTLLIMGLAHLGLRNAAPAWQCISSLGIGAAESCPLRRPLAAAWALRAWLELCVVTARSGLACHLGQGLDGLEQLPALDWADVRRSLTLAAERDPGDRTGWQIEASSLLLDGLEALAPPDARSEERACAAAAQLLALAERIAPRSAWAAAQAGLLGGTLLRLAGHLDAARSALQQAAARSEPRQFLALARAARYELSLTFAALGEHAAALQELHRHCDWLRSSTARFPHDALWAPPAPATALAAAPPAQQRCEIAPLATAIHLPTLDDSPAAARVRCAEDYIQRHLHTRLRVDEIAAHCGIGRRALEVAFRQAKHTTVVEYTRRLRVERAMEQIQLTNLPMRDIAESVGYSAASQLSRDCTALYGAPPVVARRQYRRTLAAAPAWPDRP